MITISGIADHDPGTSDHNQRNTHAEMAVLSRFARAAIARRDHSALARAYQFVEPLLARGNHSVQNAVFVSFLENILLDVVSAEELEAERLLSPRLREALHELRAHWAEIERAAEARAKASAE